MILFFPFAFHQLSQQQGVQTLLSIEVEGVYVCGWGVCVGENNCCNTRKQEAKNTYGGWL